MKGRRLTARWQRRSARLLAALGVVALSVRVIAATALAAVALSLGGIYLLTQHTAVVDLNGAMLHHRTHETTAAGILRELGIALQEGDLLLEPEEEEIRHSVPIIVRLARPALLVHDGSVSATWTLAVDVGSLLAEFDVPLFPHDRVLMQNEVCESDTPLPWPQPAATGGVRALLAEIRRPIRLSVRRAVPLTIHDGGVPLSAYTSARTVGEALHDLGLVIYQGDHVVPGLSSELSPGLAVYIERSRPVVLDVGGERRYLRTRAENVDELLASEEVTVGPKDYVLPDRQQAVERDLLVSVVRVVDEYYIEEIPIPYQQRIEPNPEMDLDQRQTVNWGSEGARRKRIRVRYENEREVGRVEEEEWIARQPVDRLIQYGTKIVLRTVDTPQGPLTYWRKLRMYATSYSASTAGVPRSASYYGITRTGMKAGRGIVAVDPSVVTLRTEVYVPGYGKAIAGDTGGGVIGRHIDLCFDDDALELWSRWVDVYLLAPAPPASQINYMLPVASGEKG